MTSQPDACIKGSYNMVIRLTDQEQDTVKRMAEERDANARKYKLATEKVVNLSSYQMDLEGAGAELVACQILGVEPDTETREGTGENFPKHDLMYEGVTIDVKTTKVQHGQLIVKKYKALNPCDWYMLVIGPFPEYWLAGFAHKSQVFKPENIKNFGWKDVYAIHQPSLLSLEQFKEAIK